MIQSLNRKIKKNIKRLSVFVIMGLIILTSTVSVAALSQKVYIKDGENTTALYAITTDTNKILSQASIDLGPDDTVERTDDDNSTVINVRRAFTVTVTDDGVKKEVNISKGTVLDAVNKSGMTLGSGDIISPESSTEVTEGMQINILRRLNINLTIGNNTKSVVVPSGTVREVLEFLNLPLGNEDSVNVDPESRVVEGMDINLVRVEYVERKENETVPYSKATTMTDSLYEGETKVEQGTDGTKEVTYQDKLVNGEVVEIKRISESIIESPKNEITYVGVKRKSSTSESGPISKGYSVNNGNGTITDHKGNVISYKSVLNGSATAYTASPGAITSTGKVAQYGYVAVDPSIIPYGTQLYITSTDGSYVYGYAVAADTGGAMLSGRRLVDLYYNSVSECYQFGVRNVNIYIL